MIVGILDEAQAEQLRALAARLAARGLLDESQIVQSVVEGTRRGGREVPAAVAAEILHVTPQTIRNWVRAGILPGRRDSTGHFFIPLDALEPALLLDQALPDIPVAISDEEINAEIAAVRAERRIASESG